MLQVSCMFVCTYAFISSIILSRWYSKEFMNSKEFTIRSFLPISFPILATYHFCVIHGYFVNIHTHTYIRLDLWFIFTFCKILSWWKPKSLSPAYEQTELRVSELKDWESQVGDKKLGRRKVLGKSDNRKEKILVRML